MKKKLYMGFLFLVLSYPLRICFAQKNEGIIYCGQKLLIGSHEKIQIEKNMSIEAKIDTGAKMASLSARDIKFIKRSDGTWVQFKLKPKNNKKNIILTKKLVRTVRIVQRKDEYSLLRTKQLNFPRPVIRMVVCIGNQEKNVLVNLIDRSRFSFPLLIGSEILEQFRLIVDVSRHNLTQSHC